MPTAALKLADYSDLAGVIVAGLTLVGILGSIFLSIRALREVQEDRRQRQAPFLAFAPGGNRLPVQFRAAGATIPGVNPAYVRHAFPRLRPDAESVRLALARGEHYGELTNFGAGPALQAETEWIVDTISFGDDAFDLDDKKRAEPPYLPQLNTMPCLPGHIVPHGTAQLTRLPTFIEKDVDKKVTEVRGRLVTRCYDVAGTLHEFHQQFWLGSGYKETPPNVHVTFGDVIPPSSPPSRSVTLLGLAARYSRHALP